MTETTDLYRIWASKRSFDMRMPEWFSNMTRLNYNMITSFIHLRLQNGWTNEKNNAWLQSLSLLQNILVRFNPPIGQIIEISVPFPDRQLGNIENKSIDVFEKHPIDEILTCFGKRWKT
jgi:hypothetical protein